MPTIIDNVALIVFIFSVSDQKADNQADELNLYSEVNENNSSDNNNENRSEVPRRDFSKPTKKKRFPKLGNYNEFTNYEKPDWPGKDECVTYVTRYPEWTQLPTVFLPPDNKGYDLRRMVSEDIDLTLKETHPLPWYPPTCDQDKFSQLKLPGRYANLPGFITTMSKEKYPDDDIKNRFLYSFGKHEMKENIAELGARIKTAQDRGQWPGWLLNTVAGTYWRIVGNTGASVACYGLALSEAPVQYSDLVLTNLAALMYKLGHVDAALKLVEEAVAVCDTEPETQFFLATLLAAKGNMTGSIHHYRTTLRLDPDYPGGVDQLRIPSCYVKYHLNTHTGTHGHTGHCQAPGQGGKGCEGAKSQENLNVYKVSGNYRVSLKWCHVVETQFFGTPCNSRLCNIPVNWGLVVIFLIIC